MSKELARSIPQGLTPSPGALRRKCACGQHTGGGEECEECRKKKETLQRSRGSQAEPATVPPIVHDVLSAPGRPLDAAARRSMESQFGRDFSQVRVHADAQAADSAHSVNALAYTVGRNIVFAAGQYAPGTAAGKRLLAHELTHVAQQGDASPGGSLRIGAANDPAEREAHEVASSLSDESSGGASRPRVTPGLVRLRRLGANPSCTKAEAEGIHQAIFDARGWLNKVIPKLEESPLKPAVVAALRRNFGSTYGVPENASLIVGRLKVGRRALGTIPFACDTAGTTSFCKENHCGWADFGSNAATICTNPTSTLDIPFPFAAGCVLHEAMHASMSFMTVDNYQGKTGYPGAGTDPLLNPDSYQHLVMELS